MPPAKRKTRKKRTTTRKAARRTTRRAKRKQVNVKLNPTVAREIWAISFLSLGILTVLSVQGTLGIIGDFWMGMLGPVIGWGVYVIPGIFFFVSLMLFFSKKIVFTGSRIFGVFLFLASILSVLHLSVPVDQIYNYAALGSHGGYTGFVTNFLLLEVLQIGRVGAAVIFVATFLTSLVLMFEVALKDIAAFMIPKIKIEVVKEPKRSTARADRKHKAVKEEDEDVDEGMPEIMIHKALIGQRDEEEQLTRGKKVDVIYEDEDEQQMTITDGLAKEVENELSQNEKATEEAEIEWEFPSLDLLKKGDSTVKVDDDELMESADKIKKKLRQFGVEVTMHEVNVGPTVIQYTLKPHEGVKLSKITSLKNDLSLALAAERVRIEAPIPGKALVGIEVPNSYRAVVHLKELLESSAFTDAKSKLCFPLGRDVSGKPVIANLETMPHMLIAGATGSGKSVAMNSFLISLLFQNSPKDLKIILIDPKRVELTSYNSIPHLLTPVIEDPEKAAISLRWVVSEMTRRYGELSSRKVRNIFEYNDLKKVKKMPRIVVVIDELADLMMAAGKEVEASICRIAQMARAVGIHLVVATQRPSVDVITGLIKANIPTRISFAVSSSIDSRTILDGIGAEDLLGRGDMLYLPTGQNKPIRIQGIFVSTEEIERVTNRVKLTIEPNYDDAIVSSETASKSFNGLPDSKAGNSDDALYESAYQLVRETKKASASLLQRRLKVGYARAARLIDLLEDNGVVGPADGAKPRKILAD
jgi:DNA segregation ATPase FtsK/SpoIIIE, S-DNA-T family